MDTPLFDNSSLPPELDERVRSELSDGEQLLWVGQPHPGRLARKATPILFFGVPWTAFALFWMVAASWIVLGAVQNNGPGGAFNAIFICFPLFGLPFVLIGLIMLSSPYWLWRQAKRTCYALTDRRAIIWQAGKFGSVNVRSYGPESLRQINRTEYPDGSGDLVFEEIAMTGRDGEGGRTTARVRHGFLAIADVRVIEEFLRRVLLNHGEARGAAEPLAE